jgi:hypothetical protein
MSISYYAFHSNGLISNVTLFDGQINALNVSEAKKIRLKVVLALNHVNEDLYDSSCVDVPLEMMPYLLEMLQQGIGYDGFGRDVVPNNMPDMRYVTCHHRQIDDCISTNSGVASRISLTADTITQLARGKR